MSDLNHQSGEEYQSIFENALEGIFQSYMDGRFLKVNPAMARIYGYDSPKDLLTSIKTIAKQIFVDPQERNRFLNSLQDNGRIEKFEARNYRKDGSVIWTQTNARIVKDNEGNALFIEGFVTDVTSRKEAEFALRASEERYRALVERLPAVIFLDDTDELQTTRYISPKVKDLLGYSPDEWVADPYIWENSLHPDDKERVLAEDHRTDKEGGAFKIEYRLRKKEGSYLWIREEASLISDVNGKPLYWQGFLSDITEQKWAEKTLQKSGEQFKKVFQANPLASCIATLNEGRFVAANDAYWKMSGYQPDEILGHTSIELGFMDNDRRHELVEKLKKEKSVKSAGGKFITKNGEIRETLEFFDLIDFEGQDCILSMFYDVTDRKKAEDELRAIAEFRQATIERVAEGLCVCHAIPDFPYVRFTVWNDRMIEITGYDMDEINKKGWYQSVYPDPDIQKAAIKRMDKMREGDNLAAEEWEITRADHKKRTLSISTATLTTEDNETHVLALMQDITEKKRAEEALKRQLQELTVLHNIAMAATSSTSVDELIQRATDIISDTLHPDNCGVELVIEHGDKYQTHPSYQGASRKEIRMPMPLTKGVTGKVIATGVSIRLGDVSQEPAYIEATKGIKSELCVPITIQGRVIGVVNIESKQANAFDEADERLFNTIAGTLATSIEQLRLFETSQRRLQELSIINAVSLASTHATNLDELIENITQIVGDSLYPDDFGLLLFNEEGDMLHSHPSYRGIATSKFPISVPLGRGITGQVAASGKPLRIANVRKHKGYIEVNSQVRSELCVPITLGEKILGVINAESLQIDFFTEDDERLLTTTASTIATALEKLRLLDQEKKRREDAETLREATTALTVSLELSTLFETILENLSRIVAFDSASIALQEGNELKIVAGKGFPESYNVIGSRIKSNGKWSAIDQKRGSLIIPDAQADPEFEQRRGSEYIRGWMGVALIVRGKIIGHIFLDSRKPNFFSQRDATMVETFASAAAVAIENAHLFKAEQRRHRESETLRQAALAITTSLELESVLDTILIVMKQVVPYDSASVLLLDGDELQIVAAQGFPPEVLNLRFPASDELFCAVRNSEEPIIIKNAQQDTCFKRWANTDYVCGWMGVPLTLRNETIGYITLDSCQEDAYNETLATLAQAFANQATSAIQNARQFEAEQRHFQEAETLRQAAGAIASTLDIQQVLTSILDNLNRVVPFDSASVFLIENDKLRLTAAKGLPDGAIDQVFLASDALLQEVWQTKLPLILVDAQKDLRFNNWIIDQVHGWMGVPLIARGAIIGYITIDSLQVGAYTEHHATLTSTFAHQAAVAIENARLYERSEQQIRQLTILRDIDTAISSSFDLRVTLNLLIGHITRELNADAAAILLYNPNFQALSLYTSSGLTLKRNALPSYIRVGESLAGQVALQRKSIIIPNLKNAPEYKTGLPTEESFTGYFGFPLTGKGQIKGVLEIYTRNEIDPTPDWLNFLRTMAGQAAIAIDNVQLFRNLQRSNQELILAYDNTLQGWGKVLELRDKETQGHTNRVFEWTIELARRLGVEGEEITHIMRGALLHDIGKLGIPDNILQKPGPLTEEEWEIMRQHPQYAFDLINPISYLRPASDIPYCHHERWDGSGYPRGLKGENIPLAARIFAVVDIWDALLYERVYRPAWPEDQVIEYLKNTAGIELDPNIVEKFLELLEEKSYKNQAG